MGVEAMFVLVLYNLCVLFGGYALGHRHGKKKSKEVC